MEIQDGVGELMSLMCREQDLINYQVLRESVFKTRLDKRIFVSSRSGLHNVINKVNSEYLIVQSHSLPCSINQEKYNGCNQPKNKDLIDIAKLYVDSEYLCLSMALRMSHRTTQENIDDMIELADEYRGEQVNIDRLKSMRSGILKLVVDIFTNIYGYTNREIEEITGYSNEYIRLLGGAGCEMENVNRFFYSIKRLLQGKIKTSMDYILDYQCGHIFVRESHQSKYFIVLRELEPQKLYKIGKIPEDILEEVFDYFAKRQEYVQKDEDISYPLDSLRAKAKAIIDMNLIREK